MSNSADGGRDRILDGGGMTYLMTTTTTTRDAETYRKIVERVEPHAVGLIARYAGMNDQGLAITAVWESKAHSDRFTAEHLMPALHELRVDNPGSGTTVDFEAFDEFHVDPPA